MDDTTFTARLLQAMKTMGMELPRGVQAGVPTGVYDGVQGNLRSDIAELRADLRRLEKERDEARDGKNAAERRADISEMGLKTAEKENRDLRDRIRDAETKVHALELQVQNVKPGKPDWVYAIEALSQGKGDQLGPKDLIAMQDKFYAVLSKMKDSDSKTTAMEDLNTALDFVEKTKKAAGVVQGVAGEQDTLDKVLNIGGKVAGIIEQRMAAASASAKAPPKKDAAQPESKRTSSGDGERMSRQPSKEMDPADVIKMTLKYITKGIHDGTDAETSARKLASTAIWATENGFGADDKDGYIASLMKEPEETIVLYGSIQTPPIPEAYCLEVARIFRVAMGMSAKDEPKVEAKEKVPAEPKTEADPAVEVAALGAAEDKPSEIEDASTTGAKKTLSGKGGNGKAKASPSPAEVPVQAAPEVEPATQA